MLTAVAIPSYDRRTIAFHWLTALLVVMLWCLGQTIDWFPKGTPRTAARSTHIVLGVTLGLVICYRAFWRGFSGRRLQPADRGWLRHFAKLTHLMLYVLLFGTVILGISNAWIRGDIIFNFLKIPPMDPGNTQLRENIENLHGLSANTLMALAAFHACAGLMHQFLWKDGVLQRMIPALKQ